jgi:hypothetical protein
MPVLPSPLYMQSPEVLTEVKIIRLRNTTGYGYTSNLEPLRNMYVGLYSEEGLTSSACKTSDGAKKEVPKIDAYF